MAGMPGAVIMPAIPRMVLVVIAAGIGIKGKAAFCQRLRRLIRRALHPRVQLDTDIRQRHLSPHANASADQRIHPGRLQESCQSAMSAAIGVDELLPDDLSILCVIELELGRVPKVLEDFSVLVGYRDSHCIASFL